MIPVHAQLASFFVCLDVYSVFGVNKYMLSLISFLLPYLSRLEDMPKRRKLLEDEHLSPNTE